MLLQVLILGALLGSHSEDQEKIPLLPAGGRERGRFEKCPEYSSLL